MTSSTVRSGSLRAALGACCAIVLMIAPPTLRIGPALAQEAASAVQDVTLENVTIGFGDTIVTAPKLTASGTRLSKDDLLAILKEDGKEAWPARLARLDAGSLSAPELRVERRLDEVKQVAVYRDVVAKGVHGGRAAELNAAGANLTVEGGAGGGTGSYGKIQAADVDLAALARLYGEPGDGKGPLQRVYAAFSVENIQFGDDDTTVSLAKLTGNDFAGRQIAATWSGAAKAFGALDLDHADAAERARVSGIAADLAEAVSVGSLEGTGFVIKTKKDEAAELKVGRLAYASAGSEPGMSLSDFDFVGAGTHSRLASVKLSGFSLAPTVATLRKLAKNAETSDSELRRLTPVIGTLTLSALSVDMLPDAGNGTSANEPGDPIAKEAPKGAASDPVHLGVRDAILDFGPPKDGVPVASRMSLAGVTLPAAMVAGVPGLGSLALYGYRDLDLNLVTDAAWDETKQELAVREVSISGKDMGRLRLVGTLGGIGPEVFDPDTAVSSFAMLSATAKSLDLTVENNGLFERFIDATAKSLSLKPDELRKEYVTASVIGVPVILGNSPAAKAIGAAMGKFVTKPGRLSISAKAKNGAGLGIADFSASPSPANVLDKLEVNAKSE